MMITLPISIETNDDVDDDDKTLANWIAPNNNNNDDDDNDNNNDNTNNTIISNLITINIEIFHFLKIRIFHHYH